MRSAVRLPPVRRVRPALLAEPVLQGRARRALSAVRPLSGRRAVRPALLAEPVPQGRARRALSAGRLLPESRVVRRELWMVAVRPPRREVQPVPSGAQPPPEALQLPVRLAGSSHHLPERPEPPRRQEALRAQPARPLQPEVLQAQRERWTAARQERPQQAELPAA